MESKQCFNIKCTAGRTREKFTIWCDPDTCPGFTDKKVGENE